MQLYNYQDIVHQYIIYARKKIYIFMECLYSNSFIRLNSFYDQRIEVTLSESIHRFSTKDIYIQQKAMFIMNYIYQKAIVEENFSYSYQKVLFLMELQIQQKVMFIIFLEVIYLKAFIRIFCTVIVSYLSEIYLFIYLICLFVLFIYLLILFIISFIHLIIVYRKKQRKIGRKSREKSGREYDQTSEIIKKKCYL